MRSHEKEKTFNCPECSKKFSCQDFLNQHKKLHISAFWCNLCNNKFNTKQALKKHTLKFHNGSASTNNLKPICSYCDKEYSNIDNLRKHKMVKNVELFNAAKFVEEKIEVEMQKANLSCPQKCSVKFGSRLALMAHLKEKHTKKGKLYECDSCDKKFSYTTSLKRHKQCDHEEEGETFQCVLCPHVAPRKEHLNRHYELVHKNATLPRKQSVKYTV